MNAKLIKLYANNCGFALCGIAKPTPLYSEKERFEKALMQNLHAKKEYLERDVEKRFNPKLLLENCKSVIVCGFNYYSGNTCKSFAHNIPINTITQEDKLKISRYAQIKDYHIFMKDKLEKLAADLQIQYGVFNYKTTVDSSSISEKVWARQSGIGYYGKNGIIQTSFGSFIFLGTLLIDREVDEYDDPNNNDCGNCCKCMSVCPTQAIIAPYSVDSNLCISHITLNKKETDFKSIAKYGWLIGCDACQESCPNNYNTTANTEAAALQAPYVENMYEILESLTPESFEHNFKDTTIYKFGYEGLIKRLGDFSS